MKKNKKYLYILLLFFIVLIFLLVVFYIRYNSYDQNKYKKISIDKSVNGNSYTISLLIPSYFEKLIDGEHKFRLEEKIKLEKDVEKKKEIEKKIERECYYYGYNEIFQHRENQRVAYVSLFEVKSNNIQPTVTLDAFVNGCPDYEIINTKAHSSKFNKTAIKKSPTSYYDIYLENDNYVLIIHTSLSNYATKEDEIDYLKNFIKTVSVNMN